MKLMHKGSLLTIEKYDFMWIYYSTCG